MDHNDKFANRLNRALTLRGIRRIDLARKCNLSQPTITLYTQGKRRPNDITIYTLAKELDVDPAWLIGFGENDDPTLMLSEEEILKRDIKRKLEDLGESDLKKVLAFMENCL